MNIFDRILRRPDDGAGAGGAGAADPGAAGAAAGDAGAGAGAGAGQGGSDGGAGAGGEGTGPYRPQGLADQYHGESDQQTIDKLLGAVNGYRQRDSDRGVPEDLAEYRQFGDVDEKVKPYFATLEGDGLFDDIAGKAKELGVSKAQLHGLLGVYMSGAAEMGLLEPAVDVAAEREALLPDGAKGLPTAEQDRAIDQRMTENMAWVTQMVERGLDKSSADHLALMLGDSAKGHKAIEFFRHQMSGAGDPRPSAGGGGGGDAKSDLQRRVALPENDPSSPKFDKASYAALQADYEKQYKGE